MGPPQHTVSMHQQVAAAQQGQVIQTQGAQVLAAAHTGSTTITTMSPLHQSQTAHQQQISADWSHGRAVQVIQQPIQNPAYLQQLYNTQGVQGQLLMPSNIALHPSLNPSQIQVCRLNLSKLQLVETDHLFCFKGYSEAVSKQPATPYAYYHTRKASGAARQPTSNIPWIYDPRHSNDSKPANVGVQPIGRY